MASISHEVLLSNLFNPPSNLYIGSPNCIELQVKRQHSEFISQDVAKLFGETSTDGELDKPSEGSSQVTNTCSTSLPQLRRC